MMAEAVAGPLLRAVADEAAERAGLAEPSRRHDKRLEGLPPPMIPGNEESPTTLCAMQARGRRVGGWVVVVVVVGWVGGCVRTCV